MNVIANVVLPYWLLNSILKLSHLKSDGLFGAIMNLLEPKGGGV
jgi:hypothetical protein